MDDSPGTVFSYTEKMVALAHCVNLTGEKLLFTLWEDDAAGEGHNSKNKFVDSKEAVVGRTGTATAEFILTKALMQKAAQGERDPKELEFYVTVEYYKDKKHASDNIELKNPDYNPPVNQPAPVAPANSQAPAPKAPSKAPGSPAASKPASQKEESGIISSITESVRNTWNELWDWAESKGTVKPDKKATPSKSEGKTTSVVEDQEAKSADCGEKYCIKKGDKNELIREINIRLAGFGGNVPTDEFTDRTEKMVKQFQRDL
uniref:Peptidoglycan-binding protein n=1 Tax=Chryseobacterium endophyticum TaxID=1854762 RepID=A0AAU6WTE9_9FLAO